MNWKETLTRHGYRITQPRIQIMRLLEDAPTALTPQQIHCQLQKQGGNLGLVSVYRTLELLTQLELVDRLRSAAQSRLYGQFHGSSPSHRLLKL